MAEGPLNDDFALLARWRGGETSAGEELFGRHFVAVSRFFRNKVPDDHDDLIQRTFLACVEGRERIAGASFRSYLFGVARRQLYESLRREYDAKCEPLTMSLAVASTGPSTALRVRERNALLCRLLRTLPADDQLVLELRYWEGLSTLELAAVLDVPHATARTRLSRARTRLARLCGSAEIDEAALRSCGA